jgi:DNA gyrase subunit B
MPEDVKKTKDMFDVLLGKKLNKRKKFIVDNGKYYLDLIDIS